MSADLIARFGRDIQIIRPSASGSYNADGLWVPGTYQELLTIVGSPQPVTGNKTNQTSPQADRNEEKIKIFTYEQTKVREGSPLKQADIILIDSKYYEVTSVENWFIPGAMNIKYYRADAVTYYGTPPAPEEAP